jgi:hypothetical protein
MALGPGVTLRKRRKIATNRNAFGGALPLQ